MKRKDRSDSEKILEKRLKAIRVLSLWASDKPDFLQHLHEMRRALEPNPESTEHQAVYCPDEIWERIALCLDFAHILRLSSTCKRFWNMLWSSQIFVNKVKEYARVPRPGAILASFKSNHLVFRTLYYHDTNIQFSAVEKGGTILTIRSSRLGTFDIRRTQFPARVHELTEFVLRRDFDWFRPFVGASLDFNEHGKVDAFRMLALKVREHENIHVCTSSGVETPVCTNITGARIVGHNPGAPGIVGSCIVNGIDVPNSCIRAFASCRGRPIYIKKSTGNCVYFSGSYEKYYCLCHVSHRPTYRQEFAYCDARPQPVVFLPSHRDADYFFHIYQGKIHHYDLHTSRSLTVFDKPDTEAIALGANSRYLFAVLRQKIAVRNTTRSVASLWVRGLEREDFLWTLVVPSCPVANTLGRTLFVTDYGISMGGSHIFLF